MDKADKVAIKSKAMDIAAGLVSDPARIVVVAKEIEAYLLGEDRDVLKADGVTFWKTKIKYYGLPVWLEADDEKRVARFNDYISVLINEEEERCNPDNTV